MQTYSTESGSRERTWYSSPSSPSHFAWIHLRLQIYKGLLPEEGMLCLPAADATFHHGLLIVILLVAALACRLPSSSCHGDGLDSILNRGLHLLTVAPLSRCHNLHTIDMNHKTMSPLLSPSDPVGGIRRGRDVDRCRSTSLPPHPVLPLRTLCRRSSGCRSSTVLCFCLTTD